jgi:tetratricopeptide (TPR) repeat protein
MNNQLPKSALQNNIGALMLMKNSPSAAKERFFASIATNGFCYKGLKDLIPDTICPKIDVEPPGLIWFLNKLRKECPKCCPKNDDLETRVPLGFEYFQHPISVNTSVDARVAAGINLSLILFREQAHDIEDLIKLLKWSIGIELEETDNFDATHCDPVLIAIAHCNIGVLRYIQQNTRASIQNFVKAKSLLVQSLESNHHSRNHPWHGASNVPMEYLQLSILLNYTHMAIQAKNEKSNEFCDNLLEVAKSIRSYKAFYRIKFLTVVCKKYIPGMLKEQEEHFHDAFEYYTSILSLARKEYGHGHVHVASILEKKGFVLFEEKQYQKAMMSYLASWHIFEQKGSPVEQSRVLYAIGRTLHDREEFGDALSMYQRAVTIRKEIEPQSKKMKLDTIQILCNICRVHHIMGNLEMALEYNQKVVAMATEMVGGGDNAGSHAFVRNRMMIQGNLFVEMGRINNAMDIFSEVARSSRDVDWVSMSHARPEMEDVDTNAFAVRAAERLGKIGRSQPHAAAA